MLADLTHMPAVRCVQYEAKGRRSMGLSALIAKSSPQLRFARRVSELADKLYMSPDHCVLYLWRRIVASETAHSRRKSVWGRVVNRMTGDDPNYVLLSGHVLRNVLRFLGEATGSLAGMPLLGGLDYLYRLDLAQDLYARFLKRAQAEGIAL